MADYLKYGDKGAKVKTLQRLLNGNPFHKLRRNVCRGTRAAVRPSVETVHPRRRSAFGHVRREGAARAVHARSADRPARHPRRRRRFDFFRLQIL